MRLLIFILALTSVFFVSKSYSNDILPEDYRPPQGEETTCLKAGISKPTVEGCSIFGVESAKLIACSEFASQYTIPNGVEYSWTSSSCINESGTYKVKTEGTRHYSNGQNLPTSRTTSLIFSNAGSSMKYKCPPDTAPEYTDIYIYPLGEVDFVCVKPPTDNEPDPDCPAPTDNDPFVFGTGQQQTVCFNNPDGSQCSIESDESGGYYMPVSYGSQEPVACTEVDPTDPDPTDPDPTDPDPTDPDPTDPDPTDPDPTDPDPTDPDPTDPDPTDPDPTDPDPTDPDPTDPDPTDPKPTPDPEDRPEPDDTDETDKTEVIDAVNQINDNLDAINNNMLDGIDSQEERLDRLTTETQTSNELLASINDKQANSDGLLNELIDGQADGNSSLSSLVDGQSEGNALLQEIADNTVKEEFTITAKRKAQDSGLNSIFSAEDLQLLTDEITTKKEELDALLETIQTEARTLIDVPTTPSGGYEERIATIKGVEVDLGLGRISDFFKLIGPAVLLCATLTALYILLGSKE